MINMPYAVGSLVATVKSMDFILNAMEIYWNILSNREE